MSSPRKIDELRAVIATHVHAHGPAQDLRRFFLERGIASLLWIGYPLLPGETRAGPEWEWHRHGCPAKSEHRPTPRLPSALHFACAFFRQIFIFIRRGRDCDLWIGVNPLNAAAGLLLRFLGRVRHVVYYVVDYTPKRFSSAWLNAVYHRLDRFCVSRCDTTWNLSPRMAEARRDFFGFDPQPSRQITVPLGLWPVSAASPASAASGRLRLVFVGHVLAKQGLQTALRAMTGAPECELTIIGDGEYLHSLQKLCAELSLKDRVRFSGFVENHDDIVRELPRHDAGLALYEEGNPESNFTRYADPGKIKLYLAAGLPVITTPVVHNAAELEQADCAWIVASDAVQLRALLNRLAGEPGLLKKSKAAAMAHAGKFDWNDIFSQALAPFVRAEAPAGPR